MNQNQVYEMPNTQNSQPKPLKLDVKPRITAFLWIYTILAIPGFIAGIIWLIIIIFVVIAGLGVVSQIDAPQQQPTTGFLLQEVRGSSNPQGVLVYELNGPITTGEASLPASSRNFGIYTELVAEDFKQIKSNPDIKNVVFKVNTPGGTVFDSKILGDLIKDLMQSKGQTEAVFYFDQIVASGGLLVAYKNQNYVVASPYGQTGSIGVILTLPNFKGLADKVGYSETVIKSSNSKDYGNPLRDLSGEERAFLQKQVDTEYENFLDIVSKGRKLDKDKVKGFANGFVYDNAEAQTLGLIDELNNLDTAVEKAATNAKLGTDYKVWETRVEPSFLENILGSSGQASLFGFPLNTAKVIDRATFFEAGKMYMIDENRI